MTSKNIFDFVLSFVGIILAIPFFVVISLILIYFYKSKSILFTQQRIGRQGKIFLIYKFRTMHISNDSNSISIKGDSRVTPIGVFLRKWKLDELPELFNILKGEMSFVGPRPDVPGYADKLVGENRKVLNLKPGITGPASLKYINEEDLLAVADDPKKYNDEIIFPDKVRINILYLNNWSLLLDLKLILDTVFRRHYSEKRYFNNCKI